jgi:hypothetical protein
MPHRYFFIIVFSAHWSSTLRWLIGSITFSMVLYRYFVLLHETEDFLQSSPSPIISFKFNLFCLNFISKSKMNTIFSTISFQNLELLSKFDNICGCGPCLSLLAFIPPWTCICQLFCSYIFLLLCSLNFWWNPYFVLFTI